MDRRDLLPYHQAFIDLINHPAVFDLILDLMGPYIQFSMSQAIIRASTDMFPGYIQRTAARPRGPLVWPIPAGRWRVFLLILTCTAPDSGNFTVFPGSHMRPFTERAARVPGPEDARHGAAAWRGGRRVCIPARDLARSPAQPFRQGAQDHPLQTTARCSCAPTTIADPTRRCSSAARRRQHGLLGDLGHGPDFRPGHFLLCTDGPGSADDGNSHRRNIFFPVFLLKVAHSVVLSEAKDNHDECQRQCSLKRHEVLCYTQDDRKSAAIEKQMCSSSARGPPLEWRAPRAQEATSTGSRRGDAVHPPPLALIVVRRVVPGGAVVPERHRALLPVEAARELRPGARGE